MEEWRLIISATMRIVLALWTQVYQSLTRLFEKGLEYKSTALTSVEKTIE